MAALAWHGMARVVKGSKAAAVVVVAVVARGGTYELAGGSLRIDDQLLLRARGERAGSLGCVVHGYMARVRVSRREQHWSVSREKSRRGVARRTAEQCEARRRRRSPCSWAPRARSARAGRSGGPRPPSLGEGIQYGCRRWHEILARDLAEIRPSSPLPPDSSATTTSLRVPRPRPDALHDARARADSGHERTLLLLFPPYPLWRLGLEASAARYSPATSAATTPIYLSSAASDADGGPGHGRLPEDGLGARRGDGRG